MYIIEFEKGVYATKGNGDPARTLKVANAQKFSDKIAAKTKMDIVLEQIKPYRRFPNAKVLPVDKVTGTLANEIKQTAKDYRQEQDYPYNHFTKLTSTGISPDYDNIEEYAEAYHQSKVKNIGLQKVLDYLKRLDKDNERSYHELEMCSDGSGIITGVRGKTFMCFDSVDDLERQINE